MKRDLAFVLQGAIVLIGVGALAFLLLEPRMEGRNAHATLFQTYFNDPFLAYAYVASISFFVALYQAYALLGDLRRKNTFSPNSVRALRTIKYCAAAMICFIVGPEAYLLIARPDDDIAGGVAIGFFLMLVSCVMVVTASSFEKKIQRAVDRT